MLTVEKTLCLPAGLVFLCARGAGFEGTLQFVSGDAQNHGKTCGASLPIQGRFVIHEPSRDTTSTRLNGGHSTFGRSVCRLSAEQMSHTTGCLFWALTPRCSQWTKRPSSSRNFVHLLCQRVPALDDEIRNCATGSSHSLALVGTAPLLTRCFSCSSRLPRFNTLRQCWLVLRRDTRMRMPPTTSRTLRAQQKESRVCVEANLCPTIDFGGCFLGENRHVANVFFVHRLQILYLLIFDSLASLLSVAFANGLILISQDRRFGDNTEGSSSLKFVSSSSTHPALVSSWRLRLLNGCAPNSGEDD